MITAQLRLTEEELAELDRHALRRGLRRSGVLALVMEVALRDKMISAIVDDGL